MPHEHHARTDELAKKLVISSTKILTKYFATALTAAFACIIFFPTSAQAQGFAPKKGALWAKLGYVYSTANSVYAGLDEVDFDAQNKVGDKVPFYNVEGDLVGGDLAIQEVALTAVYSPLSKLSLFLQAPLMKYVGYENTAKNFSSSAVGLGDIQVGSAYQWSPSDWKVFGSSVQLVTKIPMSKNYPYTNNAILGDGQFDIGFASANTLVAGPIYLNGSLAFTYRLPYEDTSRTLDIGNTLRASLSAGGAVLDNVWVTLGYQGSFAEAWVLTQGQGEARDLIQPSMHEILVSAYISLLSIGKHKLALDAWFRAPLIGQDLPVLYAGGIGLAWEADFAGQ